jgi:hypothetical protein
VFQVPKEGVQEPFSAVAAVIVDCGFVGGVVFF